MTKKELAFETIELWLKEKGEADFETKDAIKLADSICKEGTVKTILREMQKANIITKITTGNYIYPSKRDAKVASHS